MKISLPARVAVVGASGIGRHHANWWTLEGAHVCAFLGTSAESIDRTCAALRELFGFRGRGYTDVNELIAKERPQIIDVCSPNETHYAHVKAALQAGCHVLCEKPFVHDADCSRQELLAQAAELLELAQARELLLGISTQYVMAASACWQLLTEASTAGAELKSFRGELASPAKGRAPDPRPVWVDLAPHLIGALLGLCPDGEIDWATLECEFEGYSAAARFVLRRTASDDVRCELFTGRTLRDNAHVRRLELNGVDFQLEGLRDEQGVYCSKIVCADGRESIQPDMLRLLIRRFLAGTAVVTGSNALRNLDWMLRVLEAAADAGS